MTESATPASNQPTEASISPEASGTLVAADTSTVSIIIEASEKEDGRVEMRVVGPEGRAKIIAIKILDNIAELQKDVGNDCKKFTEFVN
jgi:hypothetical protein